MANFYYVKAGGTATGDAGRVATTRSTGSFAAKGAGAYYADISLALAATTAPVAGDSIFCSSAHSKEYGASKTLTIPTGVFVMSVDDSNCDQELAGAIEKATGGLYDLNLIGTAIHYSTAYSAGDELRLTGSPIFQDCDLVFSNDGAGAIELNSSTAMVVIRGGTIKSNYTGASSYIFLFNLTRTSLKLSGVAISKNTGAVDNLMHFVADGCRVEIDGGSIPAVTTLVSTNSSNIQDIAIRNCSLGAYTNVYTGTLQRTTTIQISGCDTANVEESELSEFYEASVRLDTGVYLNAGDAASINFSHKITTTANCGLGAPFRYRIAALWVDTSTAKTFTVELNQDDATDLLDSEVYLEVVHSDDTTTASHNENDGAADRLNGVAQATSTEIWTGTGGFSNENKQKLAVTTAQTGKAGLVEIYINAAVASREFYACPKITVT
jgi:hypothetical protein